ncbi:GtrA family protein [Acinetobacter sp. SK-43]|uniref:GtrA family protein n=1 Tax=Acinetobacter sp. SK-43 TaxID=2785295 RepID=UPI00188A3BAB|nr:GtrA family protein [Acinetobacter sp. SK-43]MBF4454675.1 GtrA family protein [Acinetobacter sp. SK-43]
MIDSFKLAVLYTASAIVATLCNILAQDICIYLYSGDFSIFISVLIGTGFGLVIKYILDKKYIFQYRTENAGHNRQVFFLYTVMGVITTIIFWGFEFGFQYIFETKEMRYLGGVLGLMIGYVCKYSLDKRYVFRAV